VFGTHSAIQAYCKPNAMFVVRSISACSSDVSNSFSGHCWMLFHSGYCSAHCLSVQKTNVSGSVFLYVSSLNNSFHYTWNCVCESSLT